MNLKRKGNTVEIPIWLIVVLFAALIIIFMQTDMAAKARKYIPFFRDCADVKGTCAAVSNCNQLTDKPYMMSTEKCKGDKEICCIPDKTSPNYTPPADDPLCENKIIGQTCATRKVCLKDPTEDNIQCKDLCLFCAQNPNDNQCKLTSTNRLGKSISNMDSGFKCGCTSAECVANPSGFTCVRNMCSSNTPTAGDYMCCNK
jgi:hypothetical protein